MGSAPRVALIGAEGYGRWHQANIDRLAKRGELSQCAPEEGPDVVVISTPPHTHFDYAARALRNGADVLLEKPPVTSGTQFAELAALSTETARAVQVGFQSLGSAAVSTVATQLAEGAFGEITGVGGYGSWRRDTGYFTRADWAGKLALDGVPVVDGALTNPFAHAVATAIRLLGADRATPRIELELFRANEIETHDVGWVRLEFDRRPPIVIAAALTAAEDEPPALVVHGTRGSATIYYTADEVVYDGSSTAFERVDLLENLLQHRKSPLTPLLSPLADSAAFTSVLDAVRDAGPPARITDWYEQADGDLRRRVVPGTSAAVRACAQRMCRLSEVW
jgi:predicted dehydrogenase